MASALIVAEDPLFTQARVAGLSLFERLACALGRVVDTVYVWRTPHTPRDVPAAVSDAADGRAIRPRIAWLEDPGALAAADGVFIVTRPAVLDQRLCNEMRSVPGAEAKIVRCRRSDQAEAALWYAGRERVPALLGHLRSGTAPAEALSREVHEDFAPGQKVCELITDDASRRAAERKVFLSARKESDTVIAKHFDRHISLRLTRMLMRLGLTPNQVTLVSFALGMLGSALLAVGLYPAQVAGSGLLVLSIIVDGCDGEVARLTFRESEFGRKLDFFLDNIVNACALFAVGFGYYLQGGVPFYLWSGLICGTAALASALPVYFLFFRESKTAIDPDRATTVDAFSVTENIAGRDYLYLVFLLALAGKLWFFSYLCVGGILIFLPGTLVLLAVKRLRQNNKDRGPRTED